MSLFLTFVVVTYAAEGKATEEPRPDEIDAGLRARLAVVTNVSVRSRYTLIRPGSDGTEAETVSLIVEHLVDSDGRVHYTIAGEEVVPRIQADGGVTDSNDVRRDFREVVGFDGSTARRLYGNAQSWQAGEISRKPHSRLLANPLHFGTHLRPEPVLYYLNDEHTWSAEADAQLDAGDLLVIHSRPTEEVLERVRNSQPGVDWWYRFWIDPHRAYTLVRANAYMQRRQDKEPFVYRSFEGTQWQEIQPGVWLPGHTVLTDYMTPKSGPYRLNVRLVGDHEQWVVNQPLSPQSFQVGFPPGVRVNDALLGRAYTSSTITDAGVAAAAARATQLLEHLHDSPDSPDSPGSTSAPDEELTPPVTPNVASYGIFSYTATWLYLLGTITIVVAVVIAARLVRGR